MMPRVFIHQGIGDLIDPVVPRIVPGVPVDCAVAKRKVDIEGSTSRRIDSVKNAVVGRLRVSPIGPKRERHFLADRIKRRDRYRDIAIDIEFDSSIKLAIPPRTTGDRAMIAIPCGIRRHHAGRFIKRIPSHRRHYHTCLESLEQTQATPFV
ncbi:hypothetical protein Poly51_63690 [Rubripirellula tenax]|uniref:Uncharacterized protein n=1 Tax=Rubripirellula tenax TaxID=2528015 RepID=A0A5C6E2U4_9BACT|nr:hypothetical protein Poly51_63690 [Rubripirellula tenax]